ncbi:MAG: hypothetical protein GX596_05900 [Propionibacterium sp.]|nr:hypothetical protein [Propionibacterium sp.]
MNEIVTAVLIVWLSMAIPSVAYGVVLARRAGKSVGLAVILCLVLPWVGLLFFAAQPLGERRTTGLGHYCASMLIVAAVMAVIAIFPDWIVGDPSLLGAEGYAPKDVLLLAVFIVVWALALIAGSAAISRGDYMAAGIALGVVVSFAGGMLVATVSLWGSAGVFVPELREMQASIDGRVHVGPGGWVALIALIVAYVCVVLLPFGLRLIPQEPAAPQMQPQSPAEQQWPEQQPQQPQQQWGGQQGQWPRQTGAGW